MKIPVRAAQNKQRGRMRPAGRQFDMPALDHWFLTTDELDPWNSNMIFSTNVIEMHHFQTLKSLKQENEGFNGYMYTLFLWPLYAPNAFSMDPSGVLELRVKLVIIFSQLKFFAQCRLLITINFQICLWHKTSQS